MSLNLKDIIKTTYKSKKEGEEYFKKHGYLFDPELSNISNRTYHNPTTNKTIFTSRGTNNLLNDIPADLDILFGTRNLFSNRERETKNIYNKAKDKYNTSKFSLYGHSLSGHLVSKVGKSEDNIISVNKGAGLLNPLETSRSNETSYRHRTDLISLLSSNKSNTINYGSILNINPLDSHAVNNIPKIEYA